MAGKVSDIGSGEGAEGAWRGRLAQSQGSSTCEWPRSSPPLPGLTSGDSLAVMGAQGTGYSATAQTWKCTLSNPCYIYTTGHWPFVSPCPLCTRALLQDLICYYMHVVLKNEHCKNHLLRFYCVTVMILGIEGRKVNR